MGARREAMMTVNLAQLEEWMQAGDEHEHLEFKEAKNSFSFEKLAKYCTALANESGGVMILGISRGIPRYVTGSQACRKLINTRAKLTEVLRLRIDAEDLQHPDGRVVVFRVPSRPLGLPILYKGTYWMRRGEELVPMTEDMLRRIFDETTPDYSATICPDATVDDLDPEAIKEFQAAWQRKSGRIAISRLAPGQLLADAELAVDGGITYAALILLGKRRSLALYLPNAEVVFEYRSTQGLIEYSQREEFRVGAFLYLDKIWELINARNDVQQIRQGLFMYDVPSFNEGAVREALLNAVSHRDYRLAGSIFVRQYPQYLEIVSPGGFPPGITADNILWRQHPRNRRVVENLARCGLVERSGQGADRMYEACITEGKELPDFSGTDEYQVSLSLEGQVRDPQFVEFLQEFIADRPSSLGVEDLLILNLVSREAPIPDSLKPRLGVLVAEGALERVGRARGTRYLLSERYYRLSGRRGEYTRRRGLDRETNKALLMKHVKDNLREGSPLRDLCTVLPTLSQAQVQTLLRELKTDKQIYVLGRTKAGRWFPVSGFTGDSDAE